MTDSERRAGIRKFIDKWSGDQKEIQGDQSYWQNMLQYVFGRMDATDIIGPQKEVIVSGSTKHIDVYIPDTKVLIEQKSSDKDLDKKYQQSDGELLTSYEQAKRYADNLPSVEYPNWIVTCNFREIHIYDMNHRDRSRIEIQLENLESDYYLLSFLIDQSKVDIKRETEISIRVGDLIGELYEKLLVQYDNPNDPDTLHNLNVLCVRLVFCLYAEDADLFGKHLAFNEYLSNYDPDEISYALTNLFEVLDTPEGDRKRNLPPILAAFPYVNGGLFEQEIEIPMFTSEIKELLLNDISAEFDWTEISPTIFGATFESTLNEDTKTNHGMRFTSIENIHKVIDPLFLDSLKGEYDRIKNLRDVSTRKKNLIEFHDRLSKLKFLDPASGSGNFLTESYLSLRRLENDLIKTEIESGVYSFGQGRQIAGTQLLGINPIKVSIQQFYGIEINEFAVSVAMTALWIAESQMQKKTEDILGRGLDFLPLKTYKNIVCKNALRYNWRNLVLPEEVDYIMGNPPFRGYKEKTDEQKTDLREACIINGKTIANTDSLDYVSGWYYKIFNYVESNSIECALVSTNSITQGEQVELMWKPLHEKGIKINFAYRTFRWDSEANSTAKVHCIIVGFNFYRSWKEKAIFDGEEKKTVNTINYYLKDEPVFWIGSRRKPICDVKSITLGVHLYDNHNFVFDREEYLSFIRSEPTAERFFKKWVSAEDFLYGKWRYFLDLSNCSPSEIRRMPLSYERVSKVIDYRNRNNCSIALKENPFKPKQGWKADSDYLLIPFTSSHRYAYIPMTFATSEIIVTMPELAIPNADLYDFGILESSAHLYWVRYLCGRLKSDIRYAHGIVYNNYPWPQVTDVQKEAITKTAEGIIDARRKFPDASLSDLYDPVTMPYELRKAHHANDKAVMEAYGFSNKLTETEIVFSLIEMYNNITKDE